MDLVWEKMKRGKAGVKRALKQKSITIFSNE